MSALAIIIDPWIESTDHPQYDHCFENIKTFCQHDPEVEAIALSCYAMNPNNDSMYIEKWAKNSELWFDRETKWDHLRREWRNLRWEPCGLHPAINNMTTPDHQVKFIAVSDLHIFYYCNVVNPAISSIYFLGCSWPICVKNRPTGWLQIAALQFHKLLSPDIKLLTKSSGVYDMECAAFAEIQDPWYYTDLDDIYQLDLTKIWR